MKILVVGADQTERDVVVDLTLKGSRKQLPKLTHVRLPPLQGVTPASLPQRRQAFTRAVEQLLARKKDVVLSGSLVAKSPLGWVPLFEERSLQGMRPDLIVLLEADLRELIPVPGALVRRKDTPRFRELRLQQELNRAVALAAGSPLRVVHLEKGNAKEAMRELRGILLSGGGTA